jgi:hypothetical protein
VSQSASIRSRVLPAAAVRRRRLRGEWKNSGVGSPQTLSDPDRRIVAGWAADCAERVLGLFEAEAPRDVRPRDAIARTRAFARGELAVAGEIRRRFIGGAAARGVTAPAAVAAARAAGQAAARRPIQLDVKPGCGRSSYARVRECSLPLTLVASQSGP